ncbi:hypothetical protein EJB05_49475 [Eragrostis curvula]|uniref:Uncharacterized protein n=1 Tax=Eragrostis curvula TaxID=38414 RepID=A0A5J9T4L3_9POAL|nr:hypothetical protein EJB05_49475 [Eragrostis curvula]
MSANRAAPQLTARASSTTGRDSSGLGAAVPSRCLAARQWGRGAGGAVSAVLDVRESQAPSTSSTTDSVTCQSKH